MSTNRFYISKASVYFITLVTCLLLLIPFIAMQLTNEVSWKLGDFVVAGALLFGAGYAHKILTKTSSSKIKNLVIGAAILLALTFVWTVLAVDLV